MSPDSKCGTTQGYDAHMRDRTEPCADCRSAAAAYEYRRRIDGILGRTRTEHNVGTSRRIQALVALGYTFGQIGAAVGRSQDWAAKIAHRRDSIVRTTTANRVDELYRDWCMKEPDVSTGKKKWAAAYARSTARKHGWAPPLAWDDIDDPDEQPNLGGNSVDHIDHVIVDRLVAGERVVSTSAEKVEAMRRWLAGGGSERALCKAHGWKDGRYVAREDGAA